MKNLKSFSNFMGTTANEGYEVAVLDMREEAQSRVDEIINAFNIASSELYELKKMADYVKSEYPDLAKDITSKVEPMMVSLEKEYPKELNDLLVKFR